jgi:hypothetical protein
MDSSLGSSQAKVHLVGKEARHGQSNKVTKSRVCLGKEYLKQPQLFVLSLNQSVCITPTFSASLTA